jgi:hypothetical protein
MTPRYATLATGLILLFGSSAAAQEPHVDITEVRLTGCIEAETDYRARTGLESREAVSATDAVLTAATGAPTNGRQPSAALAAVVSTPKDYAITGKLESELLTFRGQAVEIVGRVEDLAGQPAVDDTPVLRRFFVKTLQPAAGSCQ